MPYNVSSSFEVAHSHQPLLAPPIADFRARQLEEFLKEEEIKKNPTVSYRLRSFARNKWGSFKFNCWAWWHRRLRECYYTDITSRPDMGQEQTSQFFDYERARLCAKTLRAKWIVFNTGYWWD